MGSQSSNVGWFPSKGLIPIRNIFGVAFATRVVLECGNIDTDNNKGRNACEIRSARLLTGVTKR